MEQHIRGWFAVVVMLFVGIALVGCLGEVDGDDAVFACDDDDDCASGFDCLERPDGQKVCAQEPFDDPEQPDDCEPGANETAEIVDDQCVYECEEGFSDCSDDTAGCESAVEECDQLCDPDENETGSYDVETGECDYDCATGYRDCLDSVDGCESEVASCEYITDDALYVSPDGDDEEAGTPNAPLQTLDRAVQIAEFEGIERIYIAVGSYTSERTIESAIDLIGGLEPNQDWAPGQDPSTIEDGGTEAPGIAATVVVDRSGDESDDQAEMRGLAINPPEATEEEPSIATVRVHGVDEEQLVLDDVDVYVGAAHEGSDGADGEEYDADQGRGEDGEDGWDHETTWLSDPAAGGSGGDAVDCDYSDPSGEGGDGGDSGDEENHDGEDGDDGGPDGIGGEGGSGGEATGNPFQSGGLDDSSPGEDGDDGDDGAHGDAPDDVGLEHPAGQFIGESSDWTRRELDDGDSGKPGMGGGGGGAASVYAGTSDGIQTGGTGAGAGSGGCGGDGGESGETGGSAFGLIVVGGGVETKELRLHLTDGGGGGDGGLGGDAGCGGEGGSGASGGEGVSDAPAEDGGDGGDGGAGGSGAPGAGGHGGSTVGIALVDGAEWIDADDSVSFDIPDDAHGSGGEPGAPASGCPVSDSPDATGGEDGEAFDVLEFEFD